MTGRLIHSGQVVADLVLRIGQLPPRGGDILASAFQQAAGGGFNVMAAAARSEASVLYAGSHGIGPYGDLVREAMAGEGITIAHPPGGPDTGIVVALVEEGGERTFVTSPGAEGHFKPVDTTAEDFVYLTGYSLTHRHNVDALLDWLPSVPGQVLLDPGPLAAGIDWDPILPHVDILSCNAREAQLLPTVDIPVRIRRDGPDGCTVNGVRIPGYPVKAVDTTGAGDTHCGVLIAELLRGTTIEDAARRANAAAAISVTRHGPATAPARSEIDEFQTRIQPCGHSTL